MLPQTILFTLLLIFTLSTQTTFKDCNFTDYRFQSQYNLGKQDELNKTFDAMNGKLSIPDIVYPINSYTNYTFTAIKSSLTYLDSSQKAQIMGNDTIVIDGGYVQATFDMKWTRKDFLQRGGSVQAVCKSQQVIFAKNLSISKGFLVYEILDYFNVSFASNDCQIVRYEPANTSDLDLSYIRQLLNKRDDDKETARSLLTQEINKRYYTELNDSLYNEKHQLDDKFIYNWINKDKNIQIEYQVLPTGVDLEKDGLSFYFITQIKDYQKWQCGSSIPHKNLDVNKYGGIQQFVSLSIFKNTLKYGIEAGALDTILNKNNWSSRMFQFFAGDLYEVMPSVSQTYLAKEQITGSCKGISDNVDVTAEQNINQLIARTGHNCSLYIKGNTKILDIKFDLMTKIQARFQEQGKVNFYVKEFSHNLSYKQQPSFKIEDYTFANALVLNSLNRMIDTKTFGSGWPIFSMDLPQLKVMQGGYVVFYDTSHIGISQNIDQ